MSWKTRLQDTIVLVSPSRVPVMAYWMPDTPAVTRRVAVHEIPNLNGAYVQDMGAGPFRYDFPLMFAGEDCDLMAKTAEDLFYYEQGAWTVIHPTDGYLKLNLVSSKRRNDPVNSGGVITIETEWVAVGLEDANMAGFNSIQSVQAMFRAALAVMSLTAQTVKTLVDLTQRGLLGKYVADSLNRLASLFGGWTLSDSAQGFHASAKNVSQDISSENIEVYTTLVMNAAAEGLKPGADAAATTAVKRVADAVKDLADGLENDAKRYTSLGGNYAALMVNAALVGEQLFVGAFKAVADIIAANPIRNRMECVNIISRITFIYECMVRAQTVYERKSAGLELKKQYVAFRNSLGKIEEARSLMTKHLLGELYSLNAVRTVTLKKPSTVIQVAVEHMGAGAGDIDGAVDRLVESNAISGRELLLLPAGREIMVY